MSSRKFSKTRTQLWHVEAGHLAADPLAAAGAAADIAAGADHIEPRADVVATEEPLEIRLRWGGTQTRTVAVTMRTPGADRELAAGFLYSEGVITEAADVARLTPLMAAPTGLSAGPSYAPASTAPIAERERMAAELEEASACSNVLEVELNRDDEPELASLERHFFATSACGVCGKAGLETLSLRVREPIAAGPLLTPTLIAGLPAKLRAAQGLFEATGGLHAAALFDAAGNLLAVREDVGRHNALDKLIGWALLAGLLPLRGHVLLVSGRTSYEILQKSVVAGLSVVCAISAPSSLAVEIATRFGVTLVGFLRGNHCNVYSGLERIAIEQHEGDEAALHTAFQTSGAGALAASFASPAAAAHGSRRRLDRFTILPILTLPLAPLALHTLLVLLTLLTLLTVGCGGRSSSPNAAGARHSAAAPAHAAPAIKEVEVKEDPAKTGIEAGDAALAAKVRARLAGDPQLRALPIEVDAEAGAVTLWGHVGRDADRAAAIQLAHRTPGVSVVNNLIKIGPSNPPPPPNPQATAGSPR